MLAGRRGPVQAAFTTPELLELGELTDAEVVISPQELELDEHSARWLETADKTRRKNVEVLQQLAERPQNGKRKRIVLRFLGSPVAILGEDRVTAVELVRNELRPDARGDLRARATRETEALEAGLVFRSIGYFGAQADTVPFDVDSGTISNLAGRVIDPDTGRPARGEYVAGWIKRGPTGVIGTNKKDAHETVASIVDDLAAGQLGEPDLDAAPITGGRFIDYGGWEAIDEAERGAGEPHGRPRVKLCTFDELLAAASRPARILAGE